MNATATACKPPVPPPPAQNYTWSHGWLPDTGEMERTWQWKLGAPTIPLTYAIHADNAAGTTPWDWNGNLDPPETLTNINYSGCDTVYWTLHITYSPPTPPDDLAGNDDPWAP